MGRCQIILRAITTLGRTVIGLQCHLSGFCLPLCGYHGDIRTDLAISITTSGIISSIVCLNCQYEGLEMPAPGERNDQLSSHGRYPAPLALWMD